MKLHYYSMLLLLASHQVNATLIDIEHAQKVMSGPRVMALFGSAGQINFSAIPKDDVPILISYNIKEDSFSYGMSVPIEFQSSVFSLSHVDVSFAETGQLAQISISGSFFAF